MNEKSEGFASCSLLLVVWPAAKYLMSINYRIFSLKNVYNNKYHAYYLESSIYYDYRNLKSTSIVLNLVSTT